MAYDGSLKFDTKVDTSGFAKGTNTIKAQANSLKSTFLSLGKTLLAVFGVKKLIDFGKQAVNVASDLQEVQNVVDTAFGSMTYKMEEFADKAIETYGISKLAAKQTGSTFMAMARGMGIAQDNASDMAISLTGLSADMASFYNVTQDVANTALKSIFTGETETLKQFGVVMTEANLQAFALSKGIKKNISDMSQAEKVQLRYAFVMQQTALAQGDFAKTSDSWANQTRILKEQWKEFLGILGNGLIQVLTPVVKFLNTAMSYLITFANTASKVLSSIFGLNSATENTAKSTGTIAVNTEDASAGLTDMGKSAKKAAKDANKSLSPIDNLNMVAESVAASSEDAADALSDIGGVGGTDLGAIETPDTSGLEKSVEKIKTYLEPLFDSLDRLKTAFEPFAENVGQGLKWFYDNALIPLAKWTITDLLPAFIDILAAGINVLNSVIEVFKPYALWLWDSFLQPIAQWTGGLIIDALKLLADGLNSLSDWIKENQSIVANATLLIASFFAAFKIAEFITAVAPLVSTLGGLISSGTLLSTVLGAISTAFGAIFSPVTLIATALGLLIYTFIDLYNNSESFRQSIANLGETWKIALQPLAEFVGTVLSDAWNKILKPIIEFFVNTLLPNLIDTFKNLWENILVPLADFIGTVLQPVFQVLSDLLSMLWEDVILPLADAIGSILKEAWNGLYEILNKTIIPIIKSVISVLKQLWQKVINPIIDVLWKNLKPAFETVFSGIKTVIQGFKTTLTGIIKFITGTLTGDWKRAWTGIKDIFKGIFDSLVGIVKTPINLIIDIINGMISGIVSGVNAVIKAINSINFTVPDWVPAIGGKGIGFNIKEFTAPKIPKLATGTVVPANYGEFLAILGDNRREVEVVSPLSTMKQALKEAMQEMGGAGTAEIHIYLEGDAKGVFKLVRVEEGNYYKQTGRAVFVH